MRSISRKKLLVLFLVMFLNLAFVGCGNEIPGSDTPKNGTEESASFAWSIDSDCSVCHESESASMQDSTQTILGHADLSCQECHSNTGGLEDAHAKVTLESIKGATKLKMTQITEESCLVCHQDDFNAKATSEVVALTDSKGTVVNPHELPINDSHADIVCADCHATHSGETTSEVAQKECLSCHHSDVYECNTCHP